LTAQMFTYCKSDITNVQSVILSSWTLESIWEIATISTGSTRIRWWFQPATVAALVGLFKGQRRIFLFSNHHQRELEYAYKWVKWYNYSISGVYWYSAR
jgi:hypothetical protein